MARSPRIFLPVVWRFIAATLGRPPPRRPPGTGPPSPPTSTSTEGPGPCATGWGAGRDAIPAAVADVLLHDDGPELGPDQRPGGANLEAGGRGAVLADIGAHEPADAALAVVAMRLLDEGDVPPGVRAQFPRVVVG